jgi:cell division protein YceG involved in septum cleavage
METHMQILNKVQTYFNSIEEKRFYQYLIGLIAIIVLVTAGIVFQYYRSVRSLKREITRINEERQEIRTLLEKAQIVKREQKEIDAILAKDENFKIAGYFEDIVGKLGLANKKASDAQVTTALQEGKYQESVLQAKFSGMTMKDVTELLQEIELNKRVFTKELDITKSAKKEGTIDATLTIATLEPKPKEAREVAE